MENAKALIDLLSDGVGSMFKDHPRSSIVVFILGIVFAYLFYQERIANLKEQVASYQERLGEIPKETIYTGLTNRDLKREASNLVNKLRDFREETEGERRKQFQSFRTQSAAAQSNEQRQALQQQYDQVQERISTHQQERLRREFITPIRALSAAIRERLPKHEKKFDDEALDTILRTELLLGVDPISDLANNLEKQAEHLTVPLRDWFSLRWQDVLFTIAVLIGVFFWALRQFALWRQRDLLRQNTDLKQEKASLEDTTKELTEQQQSGGASPIVHNSTHTYHINHITINKT